MFKHIIEGIAGYWGWPMVLLVGLVLPSCAKNLPAQPKAVQGILDLGGWDLVQNGPVRLDGKWAFYWDASLGSLTPSSPQEFIAVPGSWLKAGHPLKGKALYKLRVLTKPGDQLYGVKLYEIPQSYRLYVDQKLVAENGHYSPTPEQSRRSLVRPVVVFATQRASFELWLEVVNLDERQPGPRRSIIFGLEKDVRRIQENQIISDMLVSGILLIMALYHLGLYVQRRREMGSLLFGLLCLVMTFRIAVTEEHYLHKYFPAFPGNLEGMLDVFSFFVLPPVFTWIFAYFFEQDFYRPVLKIVTGLFAGLSFLYLIFPLQILFNSYLLFTLMVGLYLLYVLFLSVRHRRSGSGVFLAGFVVFIATTIWDMLSYSNIIRTVYLSQIGFVAFIFAQAYALSIRFNRALAVSEQLTQTLELKVSERTAALEESNRKLAALNITDALTGIANRRHFDEMLSAEWSRARRSQRPLALLLIDVDHFKAYNDHYGHQAGDSCLRAVARTLAATLNRATDTVARYGGEEFAVLLPESSTEEARAAAEKIREAVQAARVPHTKSELGVISVSIGLKSLVPREDSSTDQLVKLADEALYGAKKLGRNRVSYQA